MVEETESNWRECVRKTIEMSPDSVTIYEMEIPYNTTIYKQMKAEGKLVAPVADWETKRHWVDYAFEELEKAGYTVASAYTAVKDAAKTKFIYRDRLWAGADLLSLGRRFLRPYQRHALSESARFRSLRAARPERTIAGFPRAYANAGRTIHPRIYPATEARPSQPEIFQRSSAWIPAERFAAPMQLLKDWGFLTVNGDTSAVES